MIPDSTPWSEVFATAAHPICAHPNKIPGLDAVGCKQCRTWWADPAYRFTEKPAQTTKQPRKRK